MALLGHATRAMFDRYNIISETDLRDALGKTEAYIASLPSPSPVVPLRRGRERGGAGGFVVDSTGPLGLGRHRMQVPLPWEVVVYPPLVSVRLRASVAEALRRREVGMKAVRRLGEGRLFESLREWVRKFGLKFRTVHR